MSRWWPSSAEEASRGVGPGRAVEQMGGRRDEPVITGAEHPDLHARFLVLSPVGARLERRPGHDQLQGEAAPGDGAAVGGAGVAPRPGIERHLDVGREHRRQGGEAGRARPARAPDQAGGADELDHAAGVNEVGVVLLGDGARHDRREGLRAGPGA